MGVIDLLVTLYPYLTTFHLSLSKQIYHVGILLQISSNKKLHSNWIFTKFLLHWCINMWLKWEWSLYILRNTT